MDIIKALGELAEAPGTDQIRTARVLGLSGEPSRAEYTDLFVVQLYPYASVYLSPEGQLGGQVQDHIAGFWRVLHQPVPRDPDHIATLFSTYSQLAHHTGNGDEPYMQDLRRQMRHAFLWEHIASWILPFVARVRELGSSTYRGWGSLVLDAIEAEVAHAGQPAMLPLHLRSAPPLPQQCDLAALTTMLFSPVTSGIILTRADLGRCARDLGMQIRIADRRYTLGTMLEQDAVRVGDWLAHEARRQAELMSNSAPSFRAIAEHWEQRALTTSELVIHATRSTEVRSMPGGLAARD
jgi:TorA maturation chaperone TorD